MPNRINPTTSINVKANKGHDFLSHLKYENSIIESPIRRTGEVGNSRFVYPSANVYIRTCISFVMLSVRTLRTDITNIAFAVDDEMKNSSRSTIRNSMSASEYGSLFATSPFTVIQMFYLKLNTTDAVMTGDCHL